MKLKIIMLGLSSVMLSSCVMVNLSDGGERIRILAPDEVSTCKNLGKTNTSVTPKALGIDRPVKTVAQELETIGRNSASKMGGDTIVPLTIVEGGSQTFSVYKCVDPNG